MSPASSAQKILDALPDVLPAAHRYVIALAGPPAAGKTTLAGNLQAMLGSKAAVLGLDAFHLDNAILADTGDRARKGAPHTFDLAGYQRTLQHLRDTPGVETPIPVFDRNLDLTRNAAAMVGVDAQILITEGNYLLLDHPPWAPLRALFDLAVFVPATIDTIEGRILDRWRRHDHTEEEALDRWNTNDEPNARLVLERSAPGQLPI